MNCILGDGMSSAYYVVSVGALTVTLDRNGSGKDPTGYGLLVVCIHCPNQSTQTLSLFAYIKEHFQGVGLLRA